MRLGRRYRRRWGQPSTPALRPDGLLATGTYRLWLVEQLRARAADPRARIPALRTASLIARCAPGDVWSAAAAKFPGFYRAERATRRRRRFGRCSGPRDGTDRTGGEAGHPANITNSTPFIYGAEPSSFAD